MPKPPKYVNFPSPWILCKIWWVFKHVKPSKKQFIWQKKKKKQRKNNRAFKLSVLWHLWQLEYWFMCSTLRFSMAPVKNLWGHHWPSLLSTHRVVQQVLTVLSSHGEGWHWGSIVTLCPLLDRQLLVSPFSLLLLLLKCFARISGIRGISGEYFVSV